MFTSKYLFIAATILVPVSGLSAQTGKLTEEEKLVREIQKARQDVSAIRARILGPIKVNGQVLSPDYVKREVVYLTAANAIQQKILEFIVEDWKERYVKEKKRTPESLKVDEKSLLKQLREGMQEFGTKYPNLDFWEVVRAQNGVSKEQYLYQMRVVAAFDKVFMDGPPDQWPEITREAIMAGSQGGNPKDFWESLVKGGRNDDGTPREMPAMWKQMIRTMVIRQMQSWTQIKYAVDGLGEGLVMDVEGRKWTTQDAFDDVKEHIFLQDLERAYTEVVVREALKQELQKNNCYPTVDEFKKSYAAHEKEFEGSLFTVSMIAIAFKGYPTIEAYRQRWRLMVGFEKLMAKDINDENLEAHLKKHNRFFNDGSVNVDLISFLAKDGKTGAWQHNGMNKARDRAQAARKLIDTGSAFDDVLTSHGEFFFSDKDRGRMGDRSLNDFRKQIRESEYTDLVTGTSLGYHLYYDAPVGRVVGPLKGPDAYYLVRVNSRSPDSEAKLTAGRTRELVKQDYVQLRFMKWANEVLTRTKVE